MNLARRIVRPHLPHRWPRRRRAPQAPGIGWPGANPQCGPSLFLDQLGFWDASIKGAARGGRPGGKLFDGAQCAVRPIPPKGSKAVISDFLSNHHYTTGPGMRGLAYGLYHAEELLGVAVFSRICRPSWAAENFILLPQDRSRSVRQRRHLTVTEAEYAALSRLAITSADAAGNPLGKGAASWFLSRCLAKLEARNRLLWTAHQQLARGIALQADQMQVIRQAAGADHGRGRGYIKGVTTWADPYENMLGRIYQILAFHYSGRTNRGRWSRERVGLRSGHRLSARTLAKASNPRQGGHISAALRLAWEGATVSIKVVEHSGARREFDAGWAASIQCGTTEPEIAAAIDVAWCTWRRAHVPAGATVALQWQRGSGTRIERFPPKHAYFTGLGCSAWYRRQTEIRHRPLTERLLAEEAGRQCRRRVDRRQLYYPTSIPPLELRSAL
jgi:hypothetical protein